MTAPAFEPLRFRELPPEDMRQRAASFRDGLATRRTVRHFADRPIPDGVVEECVRAAGLAPNGANLQPWHFAIVRSPELKRQIRVAAEAEERDFYDRRAPREWLDAIAPLGTDAEKPFLETAPCLVVVFAQSHGVAADGSAVKHYYVSESVGIATGFLLAALHHAGLATLTHTPSPMAFLGPILKRPAHERPYLIVVNGYPAVGALVPAIAKKPFDEIASFH